MAGRGGAVSRAGVPCAPGGGLRRLQREAGLGAVSFKRGVVVGVRSGWGVARSVSTGAGRRVSMGGSVALVPSRGVPTAGASPAESAINTLRSLACCDARSSNCSRCWLRSRAGAAAPGAMCKNLALDTSQQMGACELRQRPAADVRHRSGTQCVLWLRNCAQTVCDTPFFCASLSKLAQTRHGQRLIGCRRIRPCSQAS